MEAEADSPREGGGARKRTRKRPYKRKACLSTSLINMAEARREIVNALQLHRSSSVRKSAVPYGSSQLAEPSTAPALVELLEVEWFDNVSASYAWWIGFLSSLDRKNSGDESVAEGSGTGLLPSLGVEKSGFEGAGDPNPFTDDWVVFPPGENIE